MVAAQIPRLAESSSGNRSLAPRKESASIKIILSAHFSTKDFDAGLVLGPSETSRKSDWRLSAGGWAWVFRVGYATEAERDFLRGG